MEEVADLLAHGAPDISYLDASSTSRTTCWKCPGCSQFPRPGDMPLVGVRSGQGCGEPNGWFTTIFCAAVTAPEMVPPT